MKTFKWPCRSHHRRRFGSRQGICHGGCPARHETGARRHPSRRAGADRPGPTIQGTTRSAWWSMCPMPRRCKGWRIKRSSRRPCAAWCSTMRASRRAVWSGSTRKRTGSGCSASTSRASSTGFAASRRACWPLPRQTRPMKAALSTRHPWAGRCSPPRNGHLQRVRACRGGALRMPAPRPGDGDAACARRTSVPVVCIHRHWPVGAQPACPSHG